MRKEHREEMRRLWILTSAIVVILTTLVVVLEYMTGASTSDIVARAGGIFYPITMFLLGLVIGAWFVFKLKILDIMEEQEIADLPDGVTK